MIKEVSPEQLAQQIKTDAPLVILDVREPWEYALCRIEPSTHIPMNNIPLEAAGLDKSKHYAALCHHGMRSLQVANFLAAQGFDVVNISGGIDLWAQTVEPEMARY